MVNVRMYGVDRPIAGISESGDQSIGPMPYASTYNAIPSEAAVCETPNSFMTSCRPDEYIDAPRYTAKV